MDAVRMGFLHGKVPPLREAESLKSSAFVIKDDLGMSFEQKAESPTNSADIYCLPQAIQNQHMLVQVSGHCR